MSEAGNAFQVTAPDGDGPGVLVLHSHWGLTDGIRDFSRQLSDQGFTVVAPDLFDGQVATNEAEADQLLADVDPNRLTVLVQAGARALYQAGRSIEEPSAVIGFAMGGSLALWGGARLPSIFNRIVSYYGAQSIDFAAAAGSFMGHFAADDPLVTEDDRVYTESLIRLAGHSTSFHVYTNVQAGFAEPHHPAFDAEAAQLAFARTVAFLVSDA